MKKFFNILLILLVFYILYNKEYTILTQTKDYLNFEDFNNKINIYKSFKIENIHLYYQEYLNQNYKNYIHLINKVNYPNFLDINENDNYQAIKEPVLLINKKFKLDQNYFPNDLKIIEIDHIERTNEMLINYEVEQNLVSLMEYIKNNLTVFSAYRSYSSQMYLYQNSTDGLVAEGGCSEHQSGLAVDVSLRDVGLTYELENCNFYSLLYNNSYKFGFILRYPKDKENITGFPFEPWHFRYVGSEIAEVIYNQNITLEEYFYYYIPLIL